MSLPNIFTKSVIEEIINRVNQLTPETQHLRGKMTVDQMLAHCNVTYEYVFEPTKHPKPNFFIKLILKLVAKNKVTNETPYEKNGPTGPDFIIKGNKDFEFEKNRLINFINQVQELGESHFEGLESQNFGNLTATERNNMFYKHLDHHLKQFGV